jgi:acyl-CoA synthetase (AMP-forming)/AMP-acid ligase II
VTFNLADLFETVVDTVPDRVALVVGRERWTFAELDADANRFAAFLAGRGVGEGDRVGLHLPNGAPYVIAMIAALKLRAIPVNVNYRYVAAELAYLFDNAGLSGLVTDVAFAREALAGGAGALGFVVVTGGTAPAGTVPWAEAMAGDPSRVPVARSEEDRYIVYTGGTTGMPRGVVWRHVDLLFAALQGGNPGDDPIPSPEALAANILARDPMVILPAAPLIHGAAQFSFWIATLTGGKVVLLSGSFDPAAAWQACADEGVGVLYIVGDAMGRPLAEVGGAWSLPSMYCVASAGAVLSRSVRARLAERVPDAMILNNFGATEVGHQGAALYDDDDPNARPRFFMNEDTAVLGDDGRPVGPGQIGRLARRGRIPLEYWRDPEKTARTFLVVDGERWVLPGDLAMVHEDGLVDLLGRGAACINSGGEKVFPEEVEEAVKDHPAVADAIVVGVPDATWGERVVAVLSTRPGQTADPASLDAHTRHKVAGYKVPRAWVVVPHVARHPSGKPDYRWARDTALHHLE